MSVVYDGVADQTIYDEPSEVTAEGGAVTVKGPGSVKVRFTPDAAEETSNRILEASFTARGQDYFSRRRPK